jgi:hypothetical protein
MWGFLLASPKQKKYDDKAPVASMFDSLWAQCRAKRECYMCGKKITQVHKCTDQVQLHVLEDLLEAL